MQFSFPAAKIQQKLHICKKKQKNHNLLFKGMRLFVVMNEGIVFPCTNGGVRFSVGDSCHKKEVFKKYIIYKYII